jgi:hypothetical protein
MLSIFTSASLSNSLSISPKCFYPIVIIVPVRGKRTYSLPENPIFAAAFAYACTHRGTEFYYTEFIYRS